MTNERQTPPAHLAGTSLDLGELRSLLGRIVDGLDVLADELAAARKAVQQADAVGGQVAG